MLKRYAMAALVAMTVVASGAAEAKPKRTQTEIEPVAVPVAPAPYVTVLQGGRVEIETDGKTLVVDPSSGAIVVETYDAQHQPLTHAVLTPDMTTLPEPIDLDWAALETAVNPTAECGSVSASLATIDYGDHADPSMSCAMAVAALTAATVALVAACAGPQAATGACAAAIVMYLHALDNYYNSCATYTQMY